MKNRGNSFRLTSFVFLLLLSLLYSCSKSGDQNRLTIDYEKYKLDNGLDVVLHVDKSDPIVSTAIMYHVGSSREVPGKTGFAHLFEHMLFQESENIPEDEYFKKIQNAGGTLNGFTSNDFTTYFEVVPKNALEMVLWMESDRMGYFINTVTPASFAIQQNVVLNEKRQGVDNRPYGHTSYIIDKNLYPEGHPYHWQVIGEMEDVKNATVEDVKKFYNNFYGPNNATLVIAGDFNPDSVKPLVQKYFGEITKHGMVEEREKMPVSLYESKRLYYEDNFATVPEINLVWPTAEEFSDDAYALSYLAEILSDGKNAPLYKVLVKEKQLTSRVTAYNDPLELAGSFTIRVRANEGHTLKEVENGVLDAFKRFEEEGITQKDIDKVKASLERQFYNSINSVFYKSLQLSYYNTFTNNPGFIEQDIENIKAVTLKDVLAVYDKYIKDKPHVVTSFVPKGKLDLVAENSVKADIVEESIEQASEVQLPAGNMNEEIQKTPSSFDRSLEPSSGPEPMVSVPEVWTADLKDGIRVYGIEQNELPLVSIEVVLNGGFLLDDTSKLGVANLMTDIMNEGTKNKTPEELEDEIKLLGADIYMYTTNEEIIIGANTLSRNFDKTMALLEEILLEPRWDQEEFELKKIKTVNELIQSEANPTYIANVVMKKLLYGNNHIFAYDTRGNKSSVESITIDDLKNYYDNYFSPNLTTIHVAGNVSKKQVLGSLKSLEKRWVSKEVVFPEYEIPSPVSKSKIYFVDIPGSKQSVINIGYLALSRLNPDFYPATVVNYKLGGSFAGVLNMILREEKGYTYGARSNFNEQKVIAPFIASSSVRSNTTLESVTIFKTAMENYRQGISREDLEFTKNALIKSDARRFETLGSLIGMLRTISKYDLPFDYVKNEESFVRSMTPEMHQEIAQKYIVPDKMIYLVVGDARTQLNSLKSLGIGDPVLIRYNN
jgi:zinc protease